MRCALADRFWWQRINHMNMKSHHPVSSCLRASVPPVEVQCRAYKAATGPSPFSLSKISIVDIHGDTQTAPEAHPRRRDKAQQSW